MAKLIVNVCEKGNKIMVLTEKLIRELKMQHSPALLLLFKCLDYKCITFRFRIRSAFGVGGF